MDARELSGKIHYIGMEQRLRKLALKEKLATPEELALATEIEVCEMIAKRFEVIFTEHERIGLIKKENISQYNKIVEFLER